MNFYQFLNKKVALISSFVLLVLFIPVVVFYASQMNRLDNVSEAHEIKDKKNLVRKIISSTPTLIASPSATPTAVPKKPTNPIYLGMWTQGFWDDPSQTLHPEQLINLQNMIGKKTAIAHFYTGWENLPKQSFLNTLQAIQSNGWRPMISANPYFFSACEVNGKTLYKAIADGGCDAFLHEVGKNLKQYGSPLFLRFAWEMNIDSMEWSIQKTGSTPADYIAAWRRFHDIVASEGATNVLWVFSPNTITPSSISYNLLYPGESYVDWLGLDGYNWGTTQSWSKWESFSHVFSQSYNTLVSLAPGKPLMLAEVNTTNVGGDKALWYKDMLGTQLPYNFPHIKAVVFYNENRQKEKVNWLINISPSSLQSFSENINNPLYLSSF